MIQQNINIFAGRLYYTWKPKNVKTATVILLNCEIFKAAFNFFTGRMNFHISIHQDDPTSHLVPAKWDNINRAKIVRLSALLLVYSTVLACLETLVKHSHSFMKYYMKNSAEN